MAGLASPVTTYSDTTIQMRVITDYIDLIDPADVPLLEALGGLDGGSSKFRFINEGVTPEWIEDNLAPLSGVFANSATVASTDTTATVGDATGLQPGHILLVGTEQLYVTAKAASVITFSRAYAGTAASFNSVAAFAVVGMARLEGDDSDAMGYTDRVTNSNHTNIFHKEIHVSRTHNQLRQYGINGSEYDYQANKAVPELMRLMELHHFYGQRKAGTATTPRSGGGLSTFITDNLTTGASLAQSQFNTLAKAMYSDGGTGPWLAVLSPTNMDKVRAWYDTSTLLRIDRSESTVGMVMKDIVTPYGNFILQLNRWAPDGVIYAVDPKRAGWKTFYPFTSELLSKSGDAQKGEVIGEFVFCLKNDKAHGMLTSVS